MNALKKENCIIYYNILYVLCMYKMYVKKKNNKKGFN